MAIYDDGHASVALLILVIVLSVAVSLIIALLGLFLKSSKKWFYVGVLVFWLLPFFSLFAEFYEDYSSFYEYEEMMQEMDEEWIEEQIEAQDTVRQDSI
ncbi:MAG: hypothetical protein ACTHJT_08515 [Cytophaga sp.]|uniref:hypothetical protein n=1 Tax=Cytophaga sp. TaxID=29535 RepID=UPI003F7E9E6C